MAAARTPPIAEARSIFTELGYTLSGAGSEFDAERKWRVVHVSVLGEPERAPRGGRMRCFVTWDEYADALQQELERSDPGYEWAIISVETDSGDYDVIHDRKNAPKP